MSERTKKFSKALDHLILEGDRLYMAMAYECDPNNFKEQLADAFNNDNKKLIHMLRGCLHSKSHIKNGILRRRL